MPFPTDRGFAALNTKPDGTTTVMISTSVKAGELVNVFAKHVGVDNVRLGPGSGSTRARPIATPIRSSRSSVPKACSTSGCPTPGSGCRPRNTA